jgi:hypothetical protein
MKPVSDIPQGTCIILFLFLHARVTFRRPHSFTIDNKHRKDQRSLADHRFIHALIRDTDIIWRFINVHTVITFPTSWLYWIHLRRHCGDRTKNTYSITYAGQDILLFHFFPCEKPEMQMKMIRFTGSDSFFGFINLENVGLEPKIVSLSCSQAEISLFEGFQLSPPSLRGRN